MLLSSCNKQINLVEPVLKSKIITTNDQRQYTFVEKPTLQNFSICHGHTCSNISSTSLTLEEWRMITANFSAEAVTPSQEREHIRQAIAWMERIVGKKTGTYNDKGYNRPGLGLPGQLDCIDESTNTTVYLLLLQQEGLLKWHRVLNRTSRGIFTLRMQVPHSTAVILDQKSGIKYAVDSWFLDNGKPPFIIPLDHWNNGWQPDQKTLKSAYVQHKTGS